MTKKKMKIKNLFIIITVLFSLAAISSCRTLQDIKYVYSTDTLYISRNIYDSIYFKDSIFIKEKGDTVWRIEYHDRIKERLKTDTIYQDVEKVVIDKKIVEKKVVPRWCWWAVGVSGMIIITAIVLLIIKLYKKFHK